MKITDTIIGRFAQLFKVRINNIKELKQLLADEKQQEFKEQIKMQLDEEQYLLKDLLKTYNDLKSEIDKELETLTKENTSK